MTLRELRERKKLTQAEVAERGDVEQTTVSQLELGKIRDPRVSTLEALAKVYDVKLQVVLDALGESVQSAEAA
jgi:transcriptional regulator with XRE-family HTH domain